MRLHVEEEPGETNTQRVEAFSDGVFAIAITLLILEIKIPHLPASASTPHESLHHALLALWPSYLAYIFSFLVIGIYWANHHYIFKLYQKTDHVFNLLNVLFLMCVSFLPLPTAILGEYFASGAARSTAILFYNLGLLLPAVSWWLMWLYGSRNYRLIDRKLAPGFVTYLTWQYALSILLYGLAFVIAFWNAPLSLVICVGLTLLYLLPPKKPVRV